MFLFNYLFPGSRVSRFQSTPVSWMEEAENVNVVSGSDHLVPWGRKCSAVCTYIHTDNAQTQPHTCMFTCSITHLPPYLHTHTHTHNLVRQLKTRKMLPECLRYPLSFWRIHPSQRGGGMSSDLTSEAHIMAIWKACFLGLKHWLIDFDLGFQDPGVPLSPAGGKQFIWDGRSYRQIGAVRTKKGFKMYLAEMLRKASEQGQRAQL